jgi:hypothetical protein
LRKKVGKNFENGQEFLSFFLFLEIVSKKGVGFGGFFGVCYLCAANTEKIIENVRCITFKSI